MEKQLSLITGLFKNYLQWCIPTEVILAEGADKR
jgi:hypothetical protein